MNNKQIYQIIEDRILEMIDQADGKWIRPWKGYKCGFAPINFVTKKPYRGVNAFSTFIASGLYGDPRFLTFRQAKAKNLKITKGAKAIPIVFWNFKEVPDPRDSEKKINVGFARYYNVFNLRDTDYKFEEELEDIKQIDFNPLQECEKIIKSFKDAPEVKHETQQAYYSHSDYINMPQKDSFKTVEEYYSTLFHEYTHSTAHTKRLDRWSKNLSRDKEELVAEFGNIFLCASAGIECTFSNSANYLKGWMKGEGKGQLVCAAQAAQKAVDYILDVEYNKQEMKEAA